MPGPLRSALLIGLVVGLLGVAVSQVPMAARFEETAGLDWLFMLRGERTPSDELVIVSIGQASAGVLGLPRDVRNWPRGMHAQLIRRLAAAGASVIVVDLFFDEARDPAEDAELAAAIREAGNVVLTARLRQDVVGLPDVTGGDGQALRLQVVPPLEPVRRGALAAAPFPLPVVPVKVSQFWAFSPGTGGQATMPVMALHAHLRDEHPSLAAALGAGATELSPADQVRHWREKLQADPALTIAVRDQLTRAEARGSRTLLGLFAGPDSYYLNYYGRPGTITTVPYHRALREEPLRDRQGRPLDLAGKVVFVGLAEEIQAEQKDHFFFVFSGEDGLNISGVEIGATAVSNALKDELLRPLPNGLRLVILLTFGLVVGSLAGWLSPPVAVPAALLLGLAWLGGARFLFAGTHVWLPLMVPLFLQTPAALLAAALAHYQRTRAQRERIQAALGRYVPPRMVARLAREGAGIEAGAEVVHGVCLATDATRYTQLAETLTPEELGRRLNDYYALLFREVEREGGFVSDVIGDAMMAIWASTRPDQDLRRHACQAALAIAHITAGGGAALPTRVGLHAGDIRLGNIGAGQHFEYRAVGDIVNTASRMEGLNKVLGTRVLASAETVAGLPELHSRELGRFLLAGKNLPVTVHELGPAAAADGGRFATALAAFQAGRWAGAAAAFGAVLAANPDDGPARYYQALSADLASGRAPVDEILSDGAIRLTGK